MFGSVAYCRPRELVEENFPNWNLGQCEKCFLFPPTLKNLNESSTEIKSMFSTENDLKRDPGNTNRFQCT